MSIAPFESMFLFKATQCYSYRATAPSAAAHVDLVCWAPCFQFIFKNNARRSLTTNSTKELINRVRILNILKVSALNFGDKLAFK